MLNKTSTCTDKLYTLPAVSLAPPELVWSISYMLNKSTDKLFIFQKIDILGSFSLIKITKIYQLKPAKFGAKMINFKTRFSIRIPP
jgi:hypothetical protein